MTWSGRIPGTPLIVDNFQRSVAVSSSSGQLDSVWFCTHAHSDHTAGLSADWNLGRIHCSPITKAILALQFGPALNRRLVALELDRTHVIELQASEESAQQLQPGAAAAAAEPRKRKHGEFASAASAAASSSPSPPAARASTFSVQLFSSNHCPGSVMFLFRSSSSFGTILHTGDLRYEPSRFHSAALHAVVGHVDVAYIDSTFLSPGCVFPKKHSAVAEVVKSIRAVRDRHRRENAGLTIAPELDWKAFVCCEGLGSEDVLQSIRSELGEVIYCPPTLAHRAKQLQLIAIDTISMLEVDG